MGLSCVVFPDSYLEATSLRLSCRHNFITCSGWQRVILGICTTVNLVWSWISAEAHVRRVLSLIVEPVITRPMAKVHKSSEHLADTVAYSTNTGSSSSSYWPANKSTRDCSCSNCSSSTCSSFDSLVLKSKLCSYLSSSELSNSCSYTNAHWSTNLKCYCPCIGGSSWSCLVDCDNRQSFSWSSYSSCYWGLDSFSCN